MLQSDYVQNSINTTFKLFFLYGIGFLMVVVLVVTYKTLLLLGSG